MNSLQIKYDSQLVSDRVEKMFQEMESTVLDATMLPQAMIDIYTRFQEFFTVFGRPSFKLRKAVLGGPPWAEDYNSMVRELCADIGTLFKELNNLNESGRAIHSLAAAETEAIEGLIEGIEKLLEDYQVYTDETAEDLYVGDSFDDLSYVQETNLTVDTEDGLVSLQILETLDHAVEASIRAHGGTPDSWPGNLLQGVPPRAADAESFIPSPVRTSDIGSGQQADATEGDSNAIKERSSVVLAADLRGENKWPSEMVDGDPSTVWEYELMCVPNQVNVNNDPEWIPVDAQFRWPNLLEDLPAQLQKNANDPNIMTRHPMVITDQTPGNFGGILNPYASPVVVNDENTNLGANPSYTKGFDWKYQITDTEDAYKVRFVSKDWTPDSDTLLEVNVELEWASPVNITTVRVNPAILQDVGQDYLGADHFILSDVGFSVIPFEGDDNIPQTVWGTDLGLELPIDLYGPKTLTFPQQRVQKLTLYFTCDTPYKCMCAHPYVERDCQLFVEAKKLKGGVGGFLGKKRTSTVNVCIGDRYETSRPNIGEIVEFTSEDPLWGEKLAKRAGVAISDAVGGLLLGAFAAAGNLGNTAAQLAGKAGFSAGSGTVSSALQANFTPFLQGQVTGGVGDVTGAPVITSGGFNPHANLPSGVYTPAQGIGVAVGAMESSASAGWQDKFNTQVTPDTNSNMQIVEIPFVYCKQKPPESVDLAWVENQLATNGDNTWWVNVNQREGYKRDVERRQGDMAKNNYKQASFKYAVAKGGPLGYVVVTKLYFAPIRPVPSGYDSNLATGLAYMSSQAQPEGSFAQGWGDMYKKLQDQQIAKKNRIAENATKMKEKLMDKVSSGMAKNIFALGGHLVAKVINTIIGAFMSVFRHRQEKITDMKPVRQQIYYGMEGVPAFRYWVALKDIGAEANVYAESGYLVSSWFEVDGGIARVSLLSEEDVPQVFDQAYIAYYVQFGDQEEWHQIEPQAYPGTAGVPKFIEINPKVRINNPAFREITRTDSNGAPLTTDRVRVRIEMKRPTEMQEYSSKVLSYKLGIKTWA